MMMGKLPEEHLIVVLDHEMKKVSEMQTPPTIMALVHIPENDIDIKKITTGLHLVLD